MLLIHKLSNTSHFTSAEQDLNEFIIQNPEKTITLSISELSEESHVSTATIMRVCKKVGFDGFSDFKIKLATELGTFSLRNERIETNYPISKDMSSKDVKTQLINLHNQALNDVSINIDETQAEKAAQWLNDADTITIFGAGESLILGQEFSYKLLRIGKKHSIFPLEGFQQAHAYRMNANDNNVCIFISQYGRSQSILNSLKILADKGIKTILISSEPSNPMLPYATLSIIIENTEKHMKMGSFSSRTSIFFILDYIYLLMFQLQYDTYIDSLEDYHKSFSNY